MEQWLMSGLFALTSGIAIYFLKRMAMRIDTLEAELDQKLSDDHVRRLIADKLDPLRDRMTAIERKIDKLLDLAINRGQV